MSMRQGTQKDGRVLRHVYRNGYAIAGVLLVAATTAFADGQAANTVVSESIKDREVKEVDVGASQVGASEVRDGHLLGIAFGADSITGADIAESSLSKAVLQRTFAGACGGGLTMRAVDEEGAVQCGGPRAEAGFDDNPGIVCNNECEDGTLTAPKGLYFAVAKVRAKNLQEVDSDDRLECRLIAGGNQDKTGFLPAEHSQNTAATLQMQLTADLAQAGEIRLRCRDDAAGDWRLQDAKITAIRLAHLAGVAPAP